MSTENQSKKSILIVDDDATLRDVIMFDFKRWGFQVFSAEDGLDAIEVIKKEHIDVIVTDVRMPRMNGVELLDAVRAINRRLPVVLFITGYADLMAEDAYDKGACAVMSKPFDRKQLSTAVRRAMQTGPEKFGAPLEIGPADVILDIQAKGVSIGQGGMSLISDSGLAKVDQIVSFKIENPNPHLALIQGQGYVRWVRRAKAGPAERASRLALGIEFVYLEESCRLNVTNFLNGLESKAYIPKGA
jgi:CheY-like chemotaxis protein